VAGEHAGPVGGGAGGGYQVDQAEVEIDLTRYTHVYIYT